jgi:hypothetical protein
MRACQSFRQLARTASDGRKLVALKVSEAGREAGSTFLKISSRSIAPLMMQN